MGVIGLTDTKLRTFVLGWPARCTHLLNHSCNLANLVESGDEMLKRLALNEIEIGYEGALCVNYALQAACRGNHISLAEVLVTRCYGGPRKNSAKALDVRSQCKHARKLVRKCASSSGRTTPRRH